MSEDERYGFRFETHRIGRYRTMTISWRGRPGNRRWVKLAPFVALALMLLTVVTVFYQLPGQVRAGDASRTISSIMLVVGQVIGLVLLWGTRSAAHVPSGETPETSANQRARLTYNRPLLATIALYIVLIVLSLAYWLVQSVSGHLTFGTTVLTVVNAVIGVGLLRFFWWLRTATGTPPTSGTELVDRYLRSHTNDDTDSQHST